MAVYLGIDTSNYTTSLAWYDSASGEHKSIGKLLPVEEGKLGLRQSDAVFAHLKALPELFSMISSELAAPIAGVVVSTRPRPCEGSYMPCFVSGIAVAEGIAAVSKTPCYHVSHQEGHLAAVLTASGRSDLFSKQFLAWHLSGGTTELLLVTPSSGGFSIEKIGGTTDISAGQLIDRTGQKLSLSFPAGKAMDALAQTVEDVASYPVRVNENSFSLSGMENKVCEMLIKETKPALIARFVLTTVSKAVKKATQSAQKEFGELPVVFSGGVSSNSLLRTYMNDMDSVFAAPSYSADNAFGCAVLAARFHSEEGLA